MELTKEIRSYQYLGYVKLAQFTGQGHCLFANLEGLFTDASLIRETARFLVRANNRLFPKNEVTKKDPLGIFKNNWELNYYIRTCFFFDKVVTKLNFNDFKIIDTLETCNFFAVDLVNV